MSRFVKSPARFRQQSAAWKDSALRWVGWGLLAGNVVLTSSCAYYRVNGLKKYDNSTGRVQPRDADGLSIGVHDLSSRRRSHRFFARALSSYGYVPVLLSLEVDKNSTSSFDVSSHDMRLVLRTGKRLEAVDSETIAGTVAYSYWRSAFGFLLVAPGFFVVSSVTSANEELLLDYQEKSFESVRVDADHPVFHGVVFFGIPAELRDDFTMEDAFVEAKLYQRDDRGELDKLLDLPIHFQD